jgi:signal transduction histidine kinase
VRWLLWSVLLLVAVELAVPVLPLAAAHLALLLAPLLVPLAVGIAVLRFDLFDIDLLLTRTLVYLLATVVLMAGYIGLVALLDHDVDRAVDRSGLGALLVVALLAVPLQAWLRTRVGRWILGPSAESGQAVATLAARLAASPSLRESPQIVVDTLAAGLHAPVELVVGDDVVAGSGEAGGPWTREVEVRHSGRYVGRVRVGHHASRSGAPLEPREERMLAQLAAATGPMLDSLLLTEELRRERDRVSEIREAERRRLRRDLHDGLGPTLAGLTLGLDAVRSLVHTSPAQAEATVTRLSELTGGATAEIRRVVDQLAPSVLDGRALLDAIRALVALDGVAPSVSVRGDALPPVPAATEEAALRIVAEAVTNVRRHAGATSCEVAVTCDSGSLIVLVDDDGCGPPGETRGSGVGLHSMRERVHTLDGNLEVTLSPLGGTRVSARLPLRARP